MPQTIETITQPLPGRPGGTPRDEPVVTLRAAAGDGDGNGLVGGARIRSIMTTAAARTAAGMSHGPVVTVAVSAIAMVKPVMVGDVIACHADLARIGTSSITLAVEVLVRRQGLGAPERVAAADYTYMAIDGDGRPRPVLELGPLGERCHDPLDPAAGATPWMPMT